MSRFSVISMRMAMVLVLGCSVAIAAAVTNSADKSLTCCNQNDQTCDYFVQKFPSICTSSTAFIGGQAFKDYCARSCNTCIVILPTTTTSTSTTTTTTKMTTIANQNCTNCNDFVCNLYGSQYCTSYSYISGKLFKEFCAKLCNNCGPSVIPTQPPTTTATTKLTTTTITTSTGKTCCNQNDLVCNLYSSSYCTSYSYINGQLFTAYCQKVCNSC